MIPASRLVRSIIASVVAVGLAGAGVCSPLFVAECAIVREIAAVKSHCCCAENCKCGPSCGTNSENNNDQQQSTSVERDLRGLGKISTSIVRLTCDLARRPALVDFGSSGEAVAG